MRWYWQSVVHKSVFYDFGILLVFIVDPRVLFIEERDLVSFDEVVVEMDWKDLGLLHLLFCLVR